ncbi:MAG: YlxR family protein [Clostridia bacterium]|nr:YlxR family protein [Clostridia bacterium]
MTGTKDAAPQPEDGGKKKRQPARMCVACREMKPQAGLIRVQRAGEELILAPRGGRIAGRGAYVCPEEKCLTRARKARHFDRALGAAMTEELWEALACEAKHRG